MDPIEIRRPEKAELDEMDVTSWPIWEKEASVFDWHYDDRETCYVLAGRVEVEPRGSEPVEITAGDLVTFPAGMSCIWRIVEPVRKHYRFG